MSRPDPRVEGYIINAPGNVFLHLSASLKCPQCGLEFKDISSADAGLSAYICEGQEDMFIGYEFQALGVVLATRLLAHEREAHS